MADRRFVFGEDLDGVCADFYRGLRPIAAEWLGVDIGTLPERVSYGLSEWGVKKAPGGYDALHRFAVTQRELFRILPPMNWEAADRLRGGGGPTNGHNNHGKGAADQTHSFFLYPTGQRVNGPKGQRAKGPKGNKPYSGYHTSKLRDTV